jgi:hypothetical protein
MPQKSRTHGGLCLRVRRGRCRCANIPGKGTDGGERDRTRWRDDRCVLRRGLLANRYTFDACTQSSSTQPRRHYPAYRSAVLTLLAFPMDGLGRPGFGQRIFARPWLLWCEFCIPLLPFAGGTACCYRQPNLPEKSGLLAIGEIISETFRLLGGWLFLLVYSSALVPSIGSRTSAHCNRIFHAPES